MPEPPAFYHTVQLQIFEVATAPQAIPESSDKCVLFGLHRLRRRGQPNTQNSSSETTYLRGALVCWLPSALNIASVCRQKGARGLGFDYEDRAFF